MSSNLLAFLVLNSILNVEQLISTAQIIRCNYGDTSFGYNNYYACSLDTSSLKYSEIPTSIEGEHSSGKNNNDVKFLKIKNGNKLRNFTSIFCEHFPDLEIIDSKDAQIEFIGPNSLFNCLNLQRMHIKGNKLSELPENLLLTNKKLKIVDFGSCELKSLPEKFFVNQNILEELWLDLNQIKALPSTIFDSLGELRLLSINRNQITSLDSEWFSNLHNLKVLGLDRNRISVLPPGVFKSLANIEHLWLYRNKIQTIHSNSFGEHQKLAYLYIHTNRINSVDPKFIEGRKFLLFEFEYNDCADFNTRNNDEIKPMLAKCFENFVQISQSESLTDKRPTNMQQNQKTQIICGKPMGGYGNILGGAPISKGQFPWIAALTDNKGEFFCGGTLISNRKVLTAAHCIQDKGNINAKLPKDIKVLLGIHNISNFVEIGRSNVAVQKIIVHDHWNHEATSFDADLAILVLDISVHFNRYIQPVCLVAHDSPAYNLRNAFVIGYGRSENKALEEIAKAVRSPIRDSSECTNKNEGHKLISSGRTLCSGLGNGQGVCAGDSGGGLFVKYGSAYYQRGIVSSSIYGGPFECEVDDYAIFTDITKFHDWIQGIDDDN